jgi:hypothetical protein
MAFDASPGLGELAVRARVFISYARKDMAFADRVDGALRAQGFDPLIDRRDIAHFEDWWSEIQRLIVRSDTVVFILSPDAIASPLCNDEVAFAASLNKRFAPIVYRRVSASKVAELLRRPHWIDFTEEVNLMPT